MDFQAAQHEGRQGARYWGEYSIGGVLLFWGLKKMTQKEGPLQAKDGLRRGEEG